MAHLNRRSDDQDDGKRHRVLEIVESTQAKAISRFLLPIGLSVIGFFLAADRSDNKEWRKAQDERLSMFNDKIDATRSDVLVMRTQMTSQVIRQVDDNSDRIDDHEKRLQTLERAVPTP